MKRALAFVPAALWAALILALGSISDLAAPTDLPLDKVAHFSMFAILGLLLAWGVHRSGAHVSLVLLLIAGTAVGAIDELHQRGVPGRSADLRDLAADLIGCALALWLGHRLLERRGTRAAGTAGRAPDDAPREPHSNPESRA